MIKLTVSFVIWKKIEKFINWNINWGGGNGIPAFYSSAPVSAHARGTNSFVGSDRPIRRLDLWSAPTSPFHQSRTSNSNRENKIEIKKHLHHQERNHKRRFLPHQYYTCTPREIIRIFFHQGVRSEKWVMGEVSYES